MFVLWSENSVYYSNQGCHLPQSTVTLLHLLIQYNFLQGGESYFKQWLSCHLYMLMLRWCTFCLSNIQGLRLTFQLVSPVAIDRFDSLAQTIFHYPDIKTLELVSSKNILFFQNIDSRFSLSLKYMIFHVILYASILTIQCHCPEICGSSDVMKEPLVVNFFFSVVPLLNLKGQDGRSNLWLP